MGDDHDPHTGPEGNGDEAATTAGDADPASSADDSGPESSAGGDGRTPGDRVDPESSAGGDRRKKGETDVDASGDAGAIGGVAVDPTDERLRALFADVWTTLEEHGDPAALSSYMAAITAGDWRDYSDREAFELLLDSVFAPGRAWSDYEQYRPAIHAALGDYRRVAGFEEADVDRVSENPALRDHRGRVRVAVVNARQFAAVVHECGSFAAHLERYGDDGERALAGFERRFALGPRGVREFLGNLGYRPVVRRRTCLGRTLARTGVVSGPAAYDEIDDVVTRIGDLTHRRWTVVDRAFWCHGFGPDVVGLGGPVCDDAPNCWACLVEDCPSREDPIGSRR